MHLARVGVRVIVLVVDVVCLMLVLSALVVLLAVFIQFSYQVFCSRKYILYTHWIVRLLSKYEMGLDGRTPDERRRRRRCNMVVSPFGVRVLYKIRESKKKEDKFESEDLEGVWLGHNGARMKS